MGRSIDRRIILTIILVSLIALTSEINAKFILVEIDQNEDSVQSILPALPIKGNNKNSLGTFSTLPVHSGTGGFRKDNVFTSRVGRSAFRQDNMLASRIGGGSFRKDDLLASRIGKGSFRNDELLSSRIGKSSDYADSHKKDRKGRKFRTFILFLLLS